MRAARTVEADVIRTAQHADRLEYPVATLHNTEWWSSTLKHVLVSTKHFIHVSGLARNF